MIYTDQALGVFRLQSLGYSDHDDGGCGKTAEESVWTPSSASGLILAGDSLADRKRGVQIEDSPSTDAGSEGRFVSIAQDVFRLPHGQPC